MQSLLNISTSSVLGQHTANNLMRLLCSLCRERKPSLTDRKLTRIYPPTGLPSCQLFYFQPPCLSVPAAVSPFLGLCLQVVLVNELFEIGILLFLFLSPLVIPPAHFRVQLEKWLNFVRFSPSPLVSFPNKEKCLHSVEQSLHF